ncbi:zinc finger protein-domain-containing protein [Immersiella caudata]|uniref:Zinc finger protein-domain-containing protein n=1 Tax=Immersiella caudata TaxID=314043 RepID=A0AA39WPD0_9PEZI|nr:zinc finger protein-domain-containing protein [Immersiella caudata]
MDGITISQSSTPLSRIGYGSCGSVWADSSQFPDIDQCTTSTSIVLKRADGLPDRSIGNEATIHKHILSSLGPYHINIPRHTAFLQPESSTWNIILPRLPTGLRLHARCLLVEKFWNGPEDMIDAIVDDGRNQHCLIRPYLGRRRTDTASSRRSMLKSISLRNYPLHIDQIGAVGLAAQSYACAMAEGLAFLLWVAEIDACDVEFVLARPRPVPDEDDASRSDASASFTFTSGPLGEHALWILDFDCYKRLPMTGEGMKIAAERFWRNDPFYPNPNAKCEEDVALWEVFRGRFLETRAKMLAGKDEAIRGVPSRKA